MITYSEDRILNFLKQANSRFAKKNTLDFTDMQYLFEHSIELLSLTSPSDLLKKYFLSPEIIKTLLYDLNNVGLKSKHSRLRAKKNLFNILEKIILHHKKRFVKFRILDKSGYYPDCDLKRVGIHYSTVNQLPVLMTVNSFQPELGNLNYSEITWITRKELQFAICVLLSPDSGIPMIYFTDYNHLELDFETINSIPNELRFYFLIELLQFQNRFKSLDGFYVEREAIQDISAYNYFQFRAYKSNFNYLIDSYSITNQLLLRTSSFLVKSSMLWKNRTFGEEAIENVCFALEGCLHLFQKKFGDNSSKLNRKLIKESFIKNIQNGESLYEFIEEAYYKRISLIHPEPDWGASWRPFLMADDFYEYFNICRELLNYILIDRIVEY